MSDYLVPLKDGRFAMVSEEDADLSGWKWHAFERNGATYARGGKCIGGKVKTIVLHRVVAERAGIDTHPTVDHINGCQFDCRRENLRNASRAQNSRNRKTPRTNTSGFKGVSFAKEMQKWRAYVYEGKLHHIGYFADAETAGRAYDTEARRRFGEFARLNFPNKTT